MARFCKVCQRFLRANDPGATFTVPTENKHGASAGHYSGCSECAHEYSERPEQHANYVFSLQCQGGLLPPTGHEDLVRQMVAENGGDVNKPLSHVPASLCGMCRLYAREGDHMTAVRLYREDFDTDDEAAKFIPPNNDNACYSACGECQRKWAPVILRRLARKNKSLEALKPEQLSPMMLC